LAGDSTAAQLPLSSCPLLEPGPPLDAGSPLDPACPDDELKPLDVPGSPGFPLEPGSPLESPPLVVKTLAGSVGTHAPHVANVVATNGAINVKVSGATPNERRRITLRIEQESFLPGIRNGARREAGQEARFSWD